MKRLLHVGLCASGVPYNGLQRAFRQFDYKEINTATPNLNAKILEIAKEFRPDLTFIQIQTGGIIKPQTIIELKKYSDQVYNFTGDIRSPLPKWYLELGADVTLFTNMDDVNTMIKNGHRAEFVELGIDETIFNSTGTKLASAPIVFFGNNYGQNVFPLSNERIKMVEFLKSKYGNQFAYYGSGWKGKENGNINSSQIKEASLYRASKIGINLSHFNADSYSSDRLLRILATGTLCLCKRFTNIEKRFTDGVHLRVWDTFEELESLINYYLHPANEKERLQIAKQGMELCHNTYIFNHMVTEIKKIYEKRLIKTI